MKRILLLIIVFLILFVVLFSAQKSGDLIATTEDGRKVLLKPDGTWSFIQAKPAKSGWQDVISWKGQGIKNTESFTITSSEWRITWATKPGQYGDGIFQIMVYKGDSDIPDIVANVIGKDEDASYMRGKGKYHLTINSSQPWAVTIQQKTQ